jgi:hypothetical protein
VAIVNNLGDDKSNICYSRYRWAVSDVVTSVKYKLGNLSKQFESAKGQLST